MPLTLPEEIVSHILLTLDVLILVQLGCFALDGSARILTH